MSNNIAKGVLFSMSSLFLVTLLMGAKAVFASDEEEVAPASKKTGAQK